MALNIVPNRGRWYIDDYYLNAKGERKRLQRSTNVPISEPKEFAEQVAQKIYAKVTAELPQDAATTLHAPKGGALTLEAAMAKHQLTLEIEQKPQETIDTVARSAKAIYRIIPPRTLINTIDEDTFLDYVAKRRAMRWSRSGKPSTSGVPIKNNTILRELAVLSNALKAGKIKPPKWPDIKPDPARERTITPEQSIAIWYALPQQWKDYFVMYRHTGVRRAEIAKIFPEDVKLEAQFAVVNGTKTDAANRDMPFTADVAAIIAKRMESAPADAPLMPMTKKGMRAMYYALQKALKAANVPLERISYNDLRRSFCTDMLLKDVSNSKVAALMGHKTTAMVDAVYGRLHKQGNKLITSVETLTPFGAVPEKRPSARAPKAEVPATESDAEEPEAAE